VKTLNKEELKRKNIIDEFIINRTSISQEEAIKELKEVSIIIKQLSNFINRNLELSSNAIEMKIKRLISHFTINLIYELDSNIAFRRARKFEEENSITPYCFNNIQDLSYIPDEKKSIIPLGRFNKKEESRFYTTIHYADTKEQFFQTAISEINGDKLDYINILDSIPTKRFNVIYIGIFDYFIRNKEFPKFIKEEEKVFSDIFNNFKEKCIENNLPELYKSYILCSSFFSDIIKRKGNDRLYKVTSVIASRLLLSETTDAIVYESVQVTDEPSIVIKTDIVHTNITHKDAYCFKVNENLGYGIYDINLINECEIVDNKLEWEKK